MFYSSSFERAVFVRYGIGNLNQAANIAELRWILLGFFWLSLSLVDPFVCISSSRSIIVHRFWSLYVIMPSRAGGYGYVGKQIEIYWSGTLAAFYNAFVTMFSQTRSDLWPLQDLLPSRWINRLVDLENIDRSWRFVPVETTSNSRSRHHFLGRVGYVGLNNWVLRRLKKLAIVFETRAYEFDVKSRRRVRKDYMSVYVYWIHHDFVDIIDLFNFRALM